MSRHMLARNVMVTRLVTIPPETDVFDAMSLLLRHRISGAPVVGPDGEYLGVFSERCCLRALLDAAHDPLPAATAGDYLDAAAPTIDEEADLLSIAEFFRATPYRRLPVLRDGRVVGQISRRDVLRAAHDLLCLAPDRESGLKSLGSLRERHEARIA